MVNSRQLIIDSALVLIRSDLQCIIRMIVQDILVQNGLKHWHKTNWPVAQDDGPLDSFEPSAHSQYHVTL